MHSFKPRSRESWTNKFRKMMWNTKIKFTQTRIRALWFNAWIFSIIPKSMYICGGCKWRDFAQVMTRKYRFYLNGIKYLFPFGSCFSLVGGSIRDILGLKFIERNWRGCTFAGANFCLEIIKIYLLHKSKQLLSVRFQVRTVKVQD